MSCTKDKKLSVFEQWATEIQYSQSNHADLYA
jgi:hypothetical protein